MAKLHYEISLPFALCRASGSDKEAFDFIYDQRLLGIKTVKRGDDIIVLGIDPSSPPPLEEIKDAIQKEGTFWGVRVAAQLKSNELDDEVPASFPDRMNRDEQGDETTAKTWQEWIDSAGVGASTSSDSGDVIFKLVYSGAYLTSVELAEIIQSDTVIDFDVYSDLKKLPEYNPEV